MVISTNKIYFCVDLDKNTDGFLCVSEVKVEVLITKSVWVNYILLRVDVITSVLPCDTHRPTYLHDCRIKKILVSDS